MSTGSTITPQSAPKTGWSASGKLQSGNKTQQVTLQVVFPYSGDFTVEFDSDGTPANAKQTVYAEAQINWVVNGNVVQRRVTIGNGTSITGVGESIRVIMTDNTPAVIAPDGVTYGVTCQVSMGTRGGSKQPPFWVPEFVDDDNFQPVLLTRPEGHTLGGGAYTITAGQNINISIPPDAGAIMLFVTALTQTTGTLAPSQLIVSMFNSIGAGFFTKTYDPFVFNDWVPIVPGTDTINLNNGTGHAMNVAVTVGIDG